uniref:DUF4780 domain-containing protein n=1 Tax=Culex tarsalis TaxID=7177 RepID=A0A1Q3EXN0_CULTA
MLESLYFKGVNAGRFVFLLEQGYALEKAVEVTKQSKLIKNILEEIMLKALLAKGDSWLYKTVKQEDLIYSSEFRKAFFYQADWGVSIEDALEFAERRADNAVAFATGDEVIRPDLSRFLVNIRLVICKANRAAFNEEQFKMIAFKLWRKARKGEDSALPHFVECTLVPGSGHIQLICTDLESVDWLSQTFSRMELWPDAAICLMREKKFLESEFFAVSLPDSANDESTSILENLKTQNDGTDTSKWTVLTRHLQPDNKTVSLLLLIPLGQAQKSNEDATFELNYKTNRVKFSTPEDGPEDNQVAFHATFPESHRMSMEEIFERLKRDSGIDTSRWKFKFMNRRECLLNFYVDAKSAELIKQANYELRFKSKKAKFIPATWKDRGYKGQPNATK